MKFIILVAAILMSASLVQGQSPARQARSNAKDESAVLKLEREWLDAYMRRDAAAMRPMLTDDFTITYSNGQVFNKEQELANLTQPGAAAAPRITLSTEDTRVRFYGNTAITTGRFIEKGPSFSLQSRYTDIYVKQNGRWRIAASHLSRLPEERRAQQIDPRLYDLYAGQYRMPAGALVVVSREGNRLMIEPPGQPKAELTAESETQFFIQGADIRVEFTKGEKGQVNGLSLSLGGRKIQATKVQ